MPWNSGALTPTLPLGKQAAVRRATAKTKAGMVVQLRFNLNLDEVISSRAFFDNTPLRRNSDGLHFVGCREGIYGESASVTALCTADKLLTQGIAGEEDVVVAVLTSSGLKDTAATGQLLPPPPQIAPELDQLRPALEQTYGFRWPA